MKEIRIILLQLFILSFSVIVLDGGKSFILAGTGIERLVSHKDADDLEAPHHHQFSFYDDNEKWVNSETGTLSTIIVFEYGLPDEIACKTSDFSSCIWQPPKFS